jgi:hypothetical protein
VADALANEVIRKKSDFLRPIAPPSEVPLPPVAAEPAPLPADTTTCSPQSSSLRTRCPFRDYCPSAHRDQAETTVARHIQQCHLMDRSALASDMFRQYLVDTNQWVCLTCLQLRKCVTAASSTSRRTPKRPKCLCKMPFDVTNPKHIQALAPPSCSHVIICPHQLLLVRRLPPNLQWLCSILLLVLPRMYSFFVFVS